MIGKHLKEYKKKYLEERRSEPMKLRLKKNSDWKKRWMPFIKYDHDFDGAFFLNIIVYKLHIMLDYYEHGKYCMQVDESRLKIVASLRKACELGDSILDDHFCDEAYAFMDKHMKIKSSPCEDRPDRSKMDIIWDSDGNKEEYNRLLKAGHEKREHTIDEFFEYIRKHYEEWWD